MKENNNNATDKPDEDFKAFARELRVRSNISYILQTLLLFVFTLSFLSAPLS